MELGIACGCDAALIAGSDRVALKVREPATGVAHNGFDSGNIGGIELAIDGKVERAAGDEPVGHGLQAEDLPARPAPRPGQNRGVVLIIRFRPHHAGNRVFERGTGPRGDGVAVVAGAVTVGTDPSFSQSRKIHHTHDVAAMMGEADQHGKAGAAVQEGFGAVEWINQPEPFGVGAIIAEFFACDAVVRAFCCDQVPDRLFSLTVCQGDRTLVRFDVHCDAAAPVMQQNRAGGISSATGEIKERLGNGFHRDAASSACSAEARAALRCIPNARQWRMPRLAPALLCTGFLGLWSATAGAQTDLSAPNEPVGHQFLITQDDLPVPYATESVANSGDINPIPDPPALNPPEGFTVNHFATGFDHARWLAVAPNGDAFLAESKPSRLVVLRDEDGDDVADTEEAYWSRLDRSTGMVFRDDSFYVADTKAVWRFDHQDGDLEAGSAPGWMTDRDALGGSRRHWTRTLAFSPDGSYFFVAVGSRGNEAIESEPRATIQIFEDGSSEPRTSASGLRNAVGVTFHPYTVELYTVVNERDGYGDDLVSDYFTRVEDGLFYGCPYAYLGPNSAPDFVDRAPELVAATVASDVMFQSHSAPPGLVFYDGAMFPGAYRGDALVSLHGVWNRSVPAVYKIVRVRFEDGRPAGGYENFATGFWFDGDVDAELYGRPVGMAVAADGALLIADDGANVIWRIADDIEN